MAEVPSGITSVSVTPDMTGRAWEISVSAKKTPGIDAVA